jgi:hypothetical protein
VTNPSAKAAVAPAGAQNARPTDAGGSARNGCRGLRSPPKRDSLGGGFL